MERRALGKGIEALIPEKESAGSDKIIFVQTEKIKPNPFQPREDFEPESLNELTQSIKEKGIIQPVLVRRKGDGFELIAGERRWRACSQLGMKDIPVIVKDVDDEDSLELSLIENIQRQNLNPIEEARAYQYLMDKFSISQERMSEVLGKSRATIANVLRLLKLPQEVQEEMRKGRISFAHGRTLLEIEDVNQQRRLAQDIIAKGLSVRELEVLVKTQRPRLKKRVGVSVRDPIIAVLEEELQHILATKVRISRRKKRGAIVIEFYSQEDMERIVKLLRAGKAA